MYHDNQHARGRRARRVGPTRPAPGSARGSLRRIAATLTALGMSALASIALLAIGAVPSAAAATHRKHHVSQRKHHVSQRKHHATQRKHHAKRSARRSDPKGKGDQGAATGLGQLSGLLPRDHLTEESALQVNLSNETVRLPIYPGTAPVPTEPGKTEKVWFLLLDASDQGLAHDLGVAENRVAVPQTFLRHSVFMGHPDKPGDDDL